ncbi:hypothetical protein BJ165DRAFT_1407075 [Panaeolus papilionaceus]|nr:hypothetical protein BJ165DRAFT_1407075 [Panaeolus papilionaceus]
MRFWSMGDDDAGGGMADGMMEHERFYPIQVQERQEMESKSTTALPNQPTAVPNLNPTTTGLRKRIKVLERAQSLSSMNELPLGEGLNLKFRLKHDRRHHRSRTGGKSERGGGEFGADGEEAGDGEEVGEEMGSPWDEMERSNETSEEEGEGEELEEEREEEERKDRELSEGSKTATSPRAGPSSDKDKPRRPSVDTTTYNSREKPPARRGSAYASGYPQPTSSSSYPATPTTRAWYEFDLAVVVALVSPIGNWLTGGDHVKNLLLIVLLIFYLHQIIEVPWQLYQKSRPRHRPYHLSTSQLSDPTSPESRYALLASSELQKLETFFLFLTFLSPLLGALLLRYATSAVLGPDAVSWFSTGLFVLATGMRPWSHLVKRISERTEDLHDFVHYPPPGRDARESTHKELKQRVEVLEERVGRLKRRVRAVREEAGEYVDEVMQGVRGEVRRVERKCGEGRRRVEDMERAVRVFASVGTKKAASGKPGVEIASRREKGKARRTYDGVISGKVRRLLTSVMYYLVPVWIRARVLFSSLSSSPPTSPSSKSTTSKFSRPIPLQSSTLNASTISSPSQCATPLESIPEEDRTTSKSRSWYGPQSLYSEPEDQALYGESSSQTLYEGAPPHVLYGGAGKQAWYWHVADFVLLKPLGVLSWVVRWAGWVVGLGAGNPRPTVKGNVQLVEENPKALKDTIAVDWGNVNAAVGGCEKDVGGNSEGGD